MNSVIEKVINNRYEKYNPLFKDKLIDMVNGATVDFAKVGEVTTCAVITLKNGFDTTGFSACIDPEAYDYEIGCEIAIENALQQLDRIVAYLVKDNS